MTKQKRGLVDRIPWSQLVSFIVGTCLLIFSYTNCGKSFRALSATPPSATGEFASTDPGIGGSSPTPTPTGGGIPGGSTYSSKAAGKFDPNCLNNNSYDACIIWKNPVASQNSAFATILKKGTDLSSSQNFGVTLSKRTSVDKLQSSTINVTASTGSPITFNNGQFRLAYKDEGANADLAQIMAYFWITYQESEMIRRAGVFYPQGKNIPVDAYATNPSAGSVKGNGYFSPSQNKVVLGYAVAADGGIGHEMALSAEVYLHEMGHANLQWALANSEVDVYRDPNTKYLVLHTTDNTYHIREDISQIVANDQIIQIYCKTVDGCARAVNEGLADFHHLMIFQESPAMGETIVNSLSGGLNSALVPRDVRQTKTWTTDQYYSQSANVFNVSGGGTLSVGGEIHGMGSAYASILWEIYNHPQMNKNHFDKIFVEHLKAIGPNTRFQEARDALISIAEAMADSQFAGSHYGSIIRGIFDQKGVAP